MLAKYELTVSLLPSNRGRMTGLCCVVLYWVDQCNTPIRSRQLEFLSDISEFINSFEIKDTLWHLKVCWILVKMNFKQVELGLGLLIAKTDLPCLFKRLRGPAPRHPEGLEYWPRPALPPKGRGPRLGGPEEGPCPGHPSIYLPSNLPTLRTFRNWCYNLQKTSWNRDSIYL